MSEPNERRITPLDDLAEEFACRWRAGERPSVEEYAVRFPGRADEIRAVFPAVAMMEQLKPHREDSLSGSARGACPDPPPARVRRFPHRPGDRPGRHGRGLRGGAGNARPARRDQGAARRGCWRTRRCARASAGEAQAAARLHHTNIVPVFGVGERDGLCFYIMQLINGRGLDQILRPTEAFAPVTPTPSPTRGRGEQEPLTPNPSPTRGRGEQESNTTPASPPPPTRRKASRPPCPLSPDRPAGNSFARSPGLASRSPTRWPTPTRKASFTGTSSRQTCSWTTGKPYG